MFNEFILIFSGGRGKHMMSFLGKYCNIHENLKLVRNNILCKRVNTFFKTLKGTLSHPKI
jgi:hypothetical protein